MRVRGRALSFSRGNTMPGAGRSPDFSCGIKIHEGDSQTSQKVGPDRIVIERDNACDNDGYIGQHVIACRKERSLVRLPP